MPVRAGWDERLVRMRQAMEAQQLDALVLRLPENVLLLSGWWPMIGASVLVFPREGEATCIIPHCYEQESAGALWEARASYYRYGVLGAAAPALAVSQLLRETGAGKDWRRVGYEAHFPATAPSWNSAEVLVPTEQAREMYQASLPGAELLDASALLQSERRRKTAFEAERMRLASEISCIGLQAFGDAVDVGRTGVELAALVEHAIMTKGTGMGGAVRVRAYAQVAAGPQETAVAYRPNEISTTRPLGTGELAVLELGVVVDGYWADRTRVGAAGTPTDEQCRVYETVRRAKQAAIATLRPGVRAADVDAAARGVIRDAGYAESFVHITGHGLGFGYHESSPILGPESADVMAEGMLTSVEPGIYFEPMGGVRIEDDVLVTATGAEALGPFAETLT